MKRRIFSKKDGTTFVQDIQDIAEDVKNFFDSLPTKIKTWIAEAEDIIDVLEKIDQALQDGQPADTVIDFILAQIEGTADEEVYETLKYRLHDFIQDIEELPGILEDGILGDDKFAFASDVLSEVSGLERIESDTTIQIAVYFKKA